MSAHDIFRTETGDVVPSVTAAQMREIDSVAVQEFGLGLLQMMENAGRSLAQIALGMLTHSSCRVTVLAGTGGNGGGGLCCARHLLNHGCQVDVVLDRDPQALTGAARTQFAILQASGLKPIPPGGEEQALLGSDLAIDALIGYGLAGAVNGRAAQLIQDCSAFAGLILSLDIPSGMNATSGESPGVSIRPDSTLTLALPKIGLARTGGDLCLADIGIPPAVYAAAGISYSSPFRDRFWIRLRVERPAG